MTINLKDTFNNVVTMYDAARPTYPIELLNDVKEYINKNGGVVEMPQHVMLYLVKKKFNDTRRNEYDIPNTTSSVKNCERILFTYEV